MKNPMLEKKIDLDWEMGLQPISLVRIRPKQYYKIVGPLMIGIRLYSAREYYRPTVYAYPLWVEKKSIFKQPIINELSFYDDKGLTIDIYYQKHQSKFIPALNIIKSKMDFLKFDSISYTKLKNLLYECVLRGMPEQADSWGGFEYLRNIFHIAVAFNLDVAEEILSQFVNTNWRIDKLAFFNYNVDEMRLYMERLLKDKDEFIQTISKNKETFQKLSCSEIVL